MKLRYLFMASCVLWGLSSPLAIAQIQGRIYQDTNIDGQWNSVSERGIAQVRVRAYDRLGQLVISAITDTAGYYSLPKQSTQPLRIQFDQIPGGFYPTSQQFLIRFVQKPAAILDLGLYKPIDYVGLNPRFAVSIQPIGDHTDPRSDSLGVTSLALLSTNPGDKQQPLRINPRQTGSIWGLAYNRSSNQLYSAAFAKRHSGFGPLGSGGIYQTDITTGETKPLVSLDALAIPTGPARLYRALGKAYESHMNDSLMYAYVGKMALGGLDISDDETTLYTLNLYDRTLYALPIQKGSASFRPENLTRYVLPDPGCKEGTFRPFAVKYHAGKVYIGGICDAGLSGRANNLRGYVYALDPATRKFNDVLNFSLNYQRGAIEYGIGNWFAWTDDPKQVMLAEPAWWAIHPQPILSDLEFDTDGSLLIGLMDRLGHQMTTGKGTADGRWQQTISLAAGDVLRASPRRKAFRLETNAEVGEYQSAGTYNEQGPGGGEYYYDDTFTLNGACYHQENGMGGLALLPGSGQVLVSSREPVAEYNSAGVSAYNNQTGQRIGGYVAYHYNPAIEFVGRKTNHVGDIEVVGAVPPTLLGHRVWQDCNEDGVQDADENGLPQVTVELWQAGNKLAETTTDSSGLYNFNSRSLRKGIKAGAAYELRVAYQQAQYGRLNLVPVVTGILGGINSDAVAEDTYAVVRFNATASGENQLEMDFGFRCVDKPQVTAQLNCVGTDWTNAKAVLTLTGYASEDRYDLTTDSVYNGSATYHSALTIPAKGMVNAQPLAALGESNLSVRIFNKSGCYQDIHANILQSAACVRLLTLSPDDSNNNLQVSPNPTHNKVAVTYRGQSSGPVLLQLFNVDSRPIHQETLFPLSDGMYRTVLDLSRQIPGIYIVSIQQGLSVIKRRVVRF